MIRLPVGDRIGMTLLEVIVATAVLAVMVGMLLWSLSGGTRQSVKATDNLVGVLIAESVLSAMRERLAADPRYFAEIEGPPPIGWAAAKDFLDAKELWGSVVASGQQLVKPDGTPLDATSGNVFPLLQNWLDATKAGSGVWDPKNNCLLGTSATPENTTVLSVEEQRHLAGSLAMLAVRVVVAVPQPTSQGNQTAGGELLRQVLVEVHRCRLPGDTSPPPPPSWLKTEMLCPEESLTTSARSLLSTTDSWAAESELTSTRPTMTATQQSRVDVWPIGDSSRAILASVLRLVRRVNVESFRVLGATAQPSTYKTTGLMEQIALLSASQRPVAQLRRAAAIREKAIEIARAYRGCAAALGDLLARHQQFQTGMTQVKSDLEDALDSVRSVKQTLERVANLKIPMKSTDPDDVTTAVKALDKAREKIASTLGSADTNHLFQQATFYEYLFTGPGFKQVMDRARAYPKLLGDALQEAETAYVALASRQPAISGLEAQFVAVRLAEIAKANRLFSQAQTPTASMSSDLSALTGLGGRLQTANQWASKFAAGEGMPGDSPDRANAASRWDQLAGGFPNFCTMVATLKNSNLYAVEQVSSQYGTGGVVSEFLDGAGQILSTLLAAEQAAILAMARVDVPAQDLLDRMGTLKGLYCPIATVLARTRVVGPANVPPGSPSLKAADRVASTGPMPSTTASATPTSVCPQ